MSHVKPDAIEHEFYNKIAGLLTKRQIGNVMGAFRESRKKIEESNK